MKEVVMNRKLLIFAITIVFILAISAVSADENATDDENFAKLQARITSNYNSTLTLDKNYTNAGELEIKIKNPITINGNGAVIDANRSSRIFHITSDNVTISNITFINAECDDYGGAIIWQGKSGKLQNCIFKNNHAKSGGGIYWSGDAGNLSDCEFINNTANDGGALRWFGAEGLVDNCDIKNNTALNYAGAVYWRGSSGSVKNTRFSNNSASAGGAVYWFGESGCIINSTLLENKAKSNTLNVSDTNAILTLTFHGFENYINAIYSTHDLILSNVTYWEGSVKTASSSLRSDCEVGVNITLEIYNGQKNLLENITLKSDANGQLNYDYSSFDDGNYAFKAYHAADAYYTYTEASGSFYLKRGKISVEISATNISYGKYSIVDIKSDTKGLYTLFINGEIFSTIEFSQAEAENLIAKHITITKLLDSGDYSVVLRFNGSESHSPQSFSTHFKVFSVPSYVGFGNISVNYGDLIIINATSIGAVNITYQIIDSGNVSVRNGSVNASSNITLSNLAGGEYTLILTTVPDKNHESATNTSKITVIKADAVIVSDGIVTTYNSKRKMIIYVKDLNGNPISGASISVKINKVRNYISDANGIVRVSLLKIAPKRYVVSVSFDGGDNYTSISCQVSLLIKKAKPKMIAKSKTLKKKKYTVKLKTNRNKNLNKAKVTLKVKGKTYTAKTKKGKATFKLNKLTKGKYRAVIKYKGNKYYKKVTKKVRITVR